MNASSLLASPTGLSPYLRFGCLSCRLFYYRLWDLYRKVRAVSPPARSRGDQGLPGRPVSMQGGLPSG